ncbi:MAG: ABC transporter ATP-binding protein [Verrucomicrobia bacterium]|nr:MAG: ABC transporter ATP-binding protein [Verrucomicrobiota bacterium]
MGESKPRKEKELSNEAVILRLLKISWRYRRACVQVLVLQLILVAMGLGGLGLTGVAIDFLRHVIDPAVEPPRWPFGLHPPSGWPPLVVMSVLSGAILLIALVRGFLDGTYQIALSKLVHQKITFNLRTEVFEKLQRLSFRFFDNNASGAIINRVSGDVQTLRLFIEGVLMQSIVLLLTLAVYMIYMVNIHVGLTLACLSVMPLIGIATAIFSRLIRPAYRRTRALMDELVLVFSETIQGIRTVKVFDLEDHQAARFVASNERVRSQQYSIFRKVTVFRPTVEFLTQSSLFVLLGYGGFLVLDGNLPIGTGLVVFARLLQQSANQVSHIADVADSIQQSLIGARRIFEILDSPAEVDSRPGAIAVNRAKGALRFENVSFEYTEKGSVLHGVDFEVPAGEVIAVAGATGSGKSTLLSLIPRFYDPTGGRICLDGVDIRDLRLGDLRRQIGIVFQDNFLFSNTIAWNIAYGHRLATRDQIEQAARIACAHEFIREFPDGYETILGESGLNLSGGQRQRLAIARAILMEPPILLLDDPTASIDSETEHEILEAINQAIEGRTTFIVAHRLSTLARADRIVVLKGGRIAQIGTHSDLMKNPGPYRRAIDVQSIDAESLELLRQSDLRRRTAN